MDIGDIFVTNQKSFELGIENTGEIDCHWKLIPYETPFGSKFNFSKTDGTLGVRDHVRDLLRVTFMSDILGEFSETFRFALEGSSEMLTLTFKGHVVAPTFRFSEDIINFGKVSYKFAETKTVYLTNTSEVDINRSLQNEFNITNDRGKLAKDSRAEIIIEFIPCVPHVYDMVLVVDLEGVGQDMLAVPIKAECIVPKVKVQPNEFLQFDNCFLKHPKTKQIQIVNEDSLRARFEIQPQDEQSKRVATYDVDMWSGVIEPHSTQVLNVKLQTEILGPVRTNFVVKLDGHNIPVMMLILASSGGPTVKLDTQELDFGSVDVLKDQRKKFTITNVGQIDAEYTAFTKNKDSIWKVIERYGVIKASQERQITVVCTADEVQKFQDTLHIIVNNGNEHEMQLKAKGVGTTLYCKERLENQPKPELPWNIDFGTEYTYKHVPRQFFLENRGRKPMKIMWVRQNKLDRKKKPEASAKPGAAGTEVMKRTGSVSGAGGEIKEEEQFVFTVVPDQVTLGPKMGIMIEVRAFSHQIGQISEPW
jgi:hydrocephalus-inducing protein